MSVAERAFCRSAPWGWFARTVILPWALQDARPAGRMLEVGCGSGVMAEQTLRRFPDLALTATDVDPTMVAAARRRLAGWSQASAVTADATALPFSDESFEVVASYLMLHHVIDWRRAVAEIARALRPGGRLVGYDLDDTPLAAWTHRLDRSPHRLVTADELGRALAAAGLVDVMLRRCLAGYVVRFTAHKPGQPR